MKMYWNDVLSNDLIPKEELIDDIRIVIGSVLLRNQFMDIRPGSYQADVLRMVLTNNRVVECWYDPYGNLNTGGYSHHDQVPIEELEKDYQVAEEYASWYFNI